MNYVLLIHAAETRALALSQEEQRTITEAYGAFTRELRATGRAGDAARLEDTRTATTVQIRDGKRVVQDGPFAETREQLAGYYTVEGSEEEALAWASKLPGAKTGTIEVRPVAPTPPGPGTSEPKDATKEYLLLIYESEVAFASLPTVEQERQFQGYRALRGRLFDAGNFVAGARLQATSAAKSVSVAGEKRVVRDGPFAETREQLGGYFRIRAKNLDAAIEYASTMPAASAGRIEIRPVVDTSAYG